MSRASNILRWINAVDENNLLEEEPSAFTTDTQDQYHLSRAMGYTYQDRGQKDPNMDTEVDDGTKPSGMLVNGMGDTDHMMDAEDQRKMDTWR